jgi:hypothetical protein
MVLFLIIIFIGHVTWLFRIFVRAFLAPRYILILYSCCHYSVTKASFIKKDNSYDIVDFSVDELSSTVCALLSGVRWFQTDVSGLPIRPIFKDQDKIS